MAAVNYGDYGSVASGQNNNSETEEQKRRKREALKRRLMKQRGQTNRRY